MSVVFKQRIGLRNYTITLGGDVPNGTDIDVARGTISASDWASVFDLEGAITAARQHEAPPEQSRVPLVEITRPR